jgi:hypothetical protein
MGFKHSFLTLVFFFSIPLSAMAPGTVLDPLNATGQFTVSAIPELLTEGKTISLEDIQASGKLCADVCKTKGMPVIVSILASKVSWWALTTGTGFLLLSRCDLCNPELMQTIASGTSYAFGEETNSTVAKLLKNPMLCKTAQCTFAAACLGLSFIAQNNYVCNISFAMAQAIGLQTALDLSAQFLARQTNSPVKSSGKSWMNNEWLSSDICKGIINGSMDSLHAVCWSSFAQVGQKSCADVILRILLYEHAYRLAKSGCKAAQDFLATA